MSKPSGSFKFVLVPADAHEPLQEWQLSYANEDEAVSCLLDRLKVRMAALLLLHLHCLKHSLGL